MMPGGDAEPDEEDELLLLLSLEDDDDDEDVEGDGCLGNVWKLDNDLAFHPSSLYCHNKSQLILYYYCMVLAIQKENRYIPWRSRRFSGEFAAAAVVAVVESCWPPLQLSLKVKQNKTSAAVQEINKQSASHAKTKAFRDKKKMPRLPRIFPSFSNKEMFVFVFM